MLKKTHRLTQKQFDTFFALGKRKHFKHLTIITHPHDTFLAAVVAGKKVSKSAVRRNTLRRRVYARLAHSLSEQSLTGVYIVLLKPSYNSLSRAAADEFLAESIAVTTQTA